MRHAFLTGVSIPILFVAAIILGCSSRAARRGEPIGKPIQLTSQEEIQGEEEFMRHCHRCHPNGESGLGPALNNKPLPAFAIKFQIRNGIGAMPSFTDQELSDESVDVIVAYVQALRGSDGDREEKD